jgi:hypothetical protein
MIKLDESTLIESMRKSYYNRLVEILEESDVRGKEGNIVIQPGLKVRHKKSQYEYTVSDVEENPTTGDVVITLQSPEIARFEPQTGGDVISEFDDETSPAPVEPAPIEDEQELVDDDEIFVVDEKEFEKDYEVN